MAIPKKLIPFVTCVQVHRPDDQLVAYYAAAEAIISKYITVKGMEYFTSKNKLNIGSDIKRMVDVVGELAIVDRSMFETALKNTLGYKTQFVDVNLADRLNQRVNDGVTSFENLLSLDTYYSKIVIDTINANINSYKQTVVTTLLSVNDLLESVL